MKSVRVYALKWKVKLWSELQGGRQKNSDNKINVAHNCIGSSVDFKIEKKKLLKRAKNALKIEI